MIVESTILSRLDSVWHASRTYAITVHDRQARALPTIRRAIGGLRGEVDNLLRRLVVIRLLRRAASADRYPA